ncbi:hypothetical protein OPV22_025919 [Ensete ventricosum]|uniref:Uncharacterized protein n=1 Tax=Ensete ventricosum TaxID=4639 RepID=A0AAV8Q8R5_ENSVE|nr:hypothetical protein OPV22_025919 [Ensete ventricosum]
MSDQGAARNVEGTASGDEDKEGETEMLWASRRFFVLVSSLISSSPEAWGLQFGDSFAVRRRTKTMNWGPVTFRFSD